MGGWRGLTGLQLKTGGGGGAGEGGLLGRRVHNSKIRGFGGNSLLIAS